MKGLEQTKGLPAESFRIHKIVVGASYSTMTDQEAVFQNLFPCTVYLPNAYGFAYAEGFVPDTAIRNVMNRDVREVLTDTKLPTPLRVALCDALYAAVSKKGADGQLQGSLSERAQARADLLIADIPESAEVILLGPASEIIEGAVTKGLTIHVTDRSEQKVGKNYYGVTVEAAQSLAQLVTKYPQTTHIIATGMIFISETADEIFKVTNDHNLHLTLYMETGAWLAPELLTLGATKVVAEEFPFYDFAGPIPYRIYSRID